MAGFANKIEITCPMCKKFERWSPEIEPTQTIIDIETAPKRKKYAK